jgi:hypothetical protein
MDMTGDGEERGRDDAAAMGVGQQAAFGDGIVGGTDGQRVPGERRDPAGGTDEAGDDEAPYDGRDDDHSGLVGGGPADATDAAGGSRAGAGEVAADRARAENANVAEEEAGLAPGESD